MRTHTARTGHSTGPYARAPTQAQTALLHRHLCRLLQQHAQRGGGEAGSPHSHLPPRSCIAASLGSLHSTCTSPPALSKVTAKISAMSRPHPRLRRPHPHHATLTTATLTSATLTTTALDLAAPTPQVIAKISVGEAPDLIKLAKTEHLTPIEERIKDLHESMNADSACSNAPWAGAELSSKASLGRA